MGHLNVHRIGFNGACMGSIMLVNFNVYDTAMSDVT